MFIRYAKLQGRLLPYIYSAALEAHETGMPIIRPFPLAFPGYEMGENLITQYEPIVDNNSVVLQGRHGSCKITVDSQTEIAVLAQKHSNHEGVSEDVYLIQWKVPIDAGSRSESVIKIECW